MFLKDYFTPKSVWDMTLRFYVKDYKNKQMKYCGQIWSLERSLILYPFGFGMMSSLEMFGLTI